MPSAFPHNIALLITLSLVPSTVWGGPSESTSDADPAPDPAPADLGWDESDTPEAATVPDPTAAPPEANDGPTAEEELEQQKLEWRRKKYHQARGMMISGWTTLGVAYGSSILVGAIAIDLGRDRDDPRTVRYGSRMFIPLGGPIAAAVESRSVTWALVTAGASAAQIVGLSLGVTGTVRLRKYPNPDEPQFDVAFLPAREGGTAMMRLRF